MTATITAQYKGCCILCDQWYPVGTPLRLYEDSSLTSTGPETPGAVHKGVWVHAPICPEPALVQDKRPGEQVCTTCWLIHPTGACDR